MRRSLAFIKDKKQRVKNFFKKNGPNDGAQPSQSTKPPNGSRSSIKVVSPSAGTAAGDSAQRPSSTQRIIGDEKQGDVDVAEADNIVTEQARAPVDGDTANSEGATTDNPIAVLTPVHPSSPPTTAVVEDDTKNQLAGQKPTTDGEAVTNAQSATVALSTATATATRSVAAPSPPAPSAPATSKSGGMPQLVQRSSRAPIWLGVLETMEDRDSARYSTLDKILNSASASSDAKTHKMLTLREDKPESKALLQRAKAILPSLGSTRALSMAAAKGDPHGIAPYVVAGTFFVIDILLGRLGPDKQRKIRNMVFESANAINEWVSFEVNFFKRRSAVEKDIRELESLLPGLYTLALQLLCDLFDASNPSWLKAAGDNLLARVDKWQEQMEELKDHRALWSAKRKVMEEALSQDDNVGVVLEEILRKVDDREPSSEALSDQVTSEGRYKEAASWFIESPVFRKWSCHFYPFDNTDGTEFEDVPKRVLWVSGTYGTGKTTVIHRSVSELKSLAEGHLTKAVLKKETRKAKGLHVISYFCPVSRISYETILRSIARKLSFMPDFTLAPAAQKFYNEKTPLRSPDYYKKYEVLVRELLTEISKSYNVALVIDGLNECHPPKDAEVLCKFLGQIVRDLPHVWVLFSSHEHMYGPEHFQKHIEVVKVIESAPADRIKDFVKAELKHRHSQLARSGSVFFQIRGFYDELEQSLIEYANGMYAWAQTWLDITLPLNDSANTVKLHTHARKLLDMLKDSSMKSNEASLQLQPGYQRLWELGALGGWDEIRERLFRLVACAFKPLSIDTVAGALRIGIDDGEIYSEQLAVSDIAKLSSNFLFEDRSGHLAWTNGSARDFIFRAILNPGIDLTQPSAYEVSTRSNHLLVANMFISIMSSHKHPIWRDLKLKFSQWKQEDHEQLFRLHDTWQSAMGKARVKNSALAYITDYGYKHCEHAAEMQGLSDPVWSRFFREVFLCEESAFVFWRTVCCDEGPIYLLGSHNGHRFVLYAHAFAEWHLGVADISSLPPRTETTASLDLSSPEELTRALFQHAAYVNIMGGNALHLACASGNNHSLDLILQAVLYLHGGAPRALQLLRQMYRGQTPIIWALDFEEDSRETNLWDIFNMLETLLKFESQHSKTCADDHSTDDASLHCQWSHTGFFKTRIPKTALSMTISIFGQEQDMICRLLDAHKPCEIDCRPKYGETALYCAAQLGLPKVVKKLVEECHASVDILQRDGKTPLDAARRTLEGLEESERGDERAREHVRELRAKLESSYISSVDSDIDLEMDSDFDTTNDTNTNSNSDTSSSNSDSDRDNDWERAIVVERERHVQEVTEVVRYLESV